MPLDLFYTMVQKSQKWPKTQIKGGGGPALTYLGQDIGSDLLARLDGHKHVAALMHTPLFCLLICDLFEEMQELPSRKTDIFEKLVIGLLRRYAITRGLRKPFHSLCKAPANLRKLVLQLGSLAFDGLRRKQYFFTSTDLNNADVPAEALQLGLLTVSESDKFWQSDHYTFSTSRSWNFSLRCMRLKRLSARRLVKIRSWLTSVSQAICTHSGRL